MTHPDIHQATRVLDRFSQGDASAAEQLLPLVYDELRGLAASYLRDERPDHTLQATALVHEAYVKLVKSDSPSFNGKAHFMAIAARAMRRILVNHARDRRTEKRGGGGHRITLDPSIAQVTGPSYDMLDLDEALTKLAAMDARLVSVVEARFFGGLTNDEVAKVLGVSTFTVESDWRLARAWLATRLADHRAV